MQRFNSYITQGALGKRMTHTQIDYTICAGHEMNSDSL